jgi:hypothetical protein
MKPVLGTRMYTRGSVLLGGMTVVRWKEFLREITEAIGMDPVAEPACWQYPYNGKGGVGFTLCQPITESFLCLDVWQDHNGAYLFICSCVSIKAQKLYPVIARFGLNVHQEFATDLGLPDD